MPTLRDALHDLAQRFAADVLAAIRGASLDDLAAEQHTAPRREPRALQAHLRLKGQKQGAIDGPSPSPSPAPKKASLRFKPVAKNGSLARRSPADIEKTLAVVVSALRAARGKGLRSEQLQQALGLDKRELPRVLRTGIAKKALRSKGQKRATLYFAA